MQLLAILISVLVAAGLITEHQDEFLPKEDGDIYKWSTVQSALTGIPRWLVLEVRTLAAQANWSRSVILSGA